MISVLLSCCLFSKARLYISMGLCMELLIGDIKIKMKNGEMRWACNWQSNAMNHPASSPGSSMTNTDVSSVSIPEVPLFLQSLWVKSIGRSMNHVKGHVPLTSMDEQFDLDAGSVLCFQDNLKNWTRVLASDGVDTSYRSDDTLLPWRLTANVSLLSIHACSAFLQIVKACWCFVCLVSMTVIVFAESASRSHSDQLRQSNIQAYFSNGMCVFM